jgi:CRISPR-associated protein Csm5
MSTIMTTYTVHGEVLTPIHIGTGDQIDPMEYVIENDHFYRFNLEETVRGMDHSDQTRFMELCNLPNPATLRRFVVDKLPWRDHILYEAKATSAVRDKYQDSLDQVRNQLLISPIMRDPVSWRPFIPGSSLKGSLRTALLNRRLHKLTEMPPEPDARNRWGSQNLERQILGNFMPRERKKEIPNDPFKLIKVSDAYLREDKATVARVINLTYNTVGSDNQAEEIPMTFECIEATPERPVGFDCTITLLDRQIPRKNESSLDHLEALRQGKEISIDDILECDGFYWDCIDEELGRFGKEAPPVSIYDKIFENLEWFKDQILLRVGRFSHFESLTIKEFRKLARRPDGKPRPVDSQGKEMTITRNLYEGKYPMGWVRLTINEEKPVHVQSRGNKVC